MAVHGTDLNTVQVRLRSTVYIRPIQRRVIELSNVLSECNTKDLQIFFPFLVEHIFGVNPSYGSGWNLLRIIKRQDVGDFEALFKFLHPFGILFEVIYKLLGDVYLKYEYPLTLLPSRLKQIILEGSVSQFYLDKLQIDPNLREPTGLLLNAFEFYLFHFAFHLVNSWLPHFDPGFSGSHETVYLHLSDQYLQHFLPIDRSIVLPVVPAHQTIQLPRSPPPPQAQPPKASKLFKTSVVKLGSTSLSPTTVSQPHAEIWRSETFLQIIFNFWLSVPEQLNSNPFVKIKSQKLFMHQGRFGFDFRIPPMYRNHYFSPDMITAEETLPREDHLRVVRNMIKHIHYFVNNQHNDGSAMDELRKAINSLSRRPLYIFLRRHIYHWPLDSSFILILETYLSFIQPWRYVKYNVRGSGESNFVDSRWFTFVVENFPAYTIIIREIIPRFSRMDLTSPKHAHMLFRLSKVLSQPDLVPILKDIERNFDESNGINQDGHQTVASSPGTPKSPCSPSTPGTPGTPGTPTSHSNSLTFPLFNRLNVVIKQEIQELESSNFQYKTLFGREFHDQVFEFVLSIQQSLSLVKYLLNSALAERRTRRANLVHRIQDFFFSGANKDDYTVDERQKTVTYLEHSIQFLCQIFDLPSIQMQSDNRSKVDVSGSSMNSTGSHSQQLGAVEPTVINPKDWQRRTKLIRYEANPDLEPIRSTEITFLIRFLHHLSTRINEKYKDELKEIWEKENFWGCVARQLLAPPCKYYYFDKTVPGNFAPRVADQLPPRVCLRTLASHQTLSYIFLSGVLAYLYGYPVVPFYLLMFSLFVCVIFAKAFIDFYLCHRRPSFQPTTEPQPDRFVPLDVSFTD